MSDLDRLRAELKKKRQAVTNKINRINKTTGAKVAGSEFDPRRAAGVEKTYNKRQLEVHLEQLNDFMRRGNQFVGLKGGTPATRGEWNVLKRREAAQTEARIAHEARLEALQTPSGLSGLGNQAMVFQGKGATNRGPYEVMALRPQDISSRESLSKISSLLMKEVKVDYLPSKLKNGQQSMVNVLEAMGDQAEADRIAGLSENQFWAFSIGTNIAEAIFMKYGIEQATRKDPTRKESWQDKVISDTADELGEYLNWAESQPKYKSEASESTGLTR